MAKRKSARRKAPAAKKERGAGGSSGAEVSSPPNRDPANVEEIGETPVVKSPLDTHGYKMVRLPKNGLRGLLVSTCIHPRDIDPEKEASEDLRSCAFSKISEFNQKHLQLKTKTPAEANGNGENRTSRNQPEAKEEEEKRYKFLKATKKQQVDSERKRERINSDSQKKTKCRQGVHEQDDEMQQFCSEKCICALYVKAGFFQDPKDIPGMAHFCEHVVSLGSESYPETEAFSKFVEAEGGWSNARTEHECTVHYFYVNYDKIEEALNMFVDMFAKPILRTADLLKEMDNVNSEYETKKLYDELRHRSLVESCIKEGQGSSSFGFGSKDTLNKPDIVDKLKKWYKEYYFGENMLFALQGPLPLAELEEYFEEYGSKIPAKGEAVAPATAVPPQQQDLEEPFDMEKWNRFYYMDIAGPTTFMAVTWALHPKFGKNYETKPLYYFNYLFSHKGQGSLDWYLKQKGWITSLLVNTPESSWYANEYYTIFSITLELTPEGLAQREEILSAVFSFIKLLQEKKASQEIFNEIQQLQADIFHYRSDMNISDPTFGRKFEEKYANETLSALLHVMSKTDKLEEVFLQAFLIRKYDPAVLDEFLEGLDPGKAMVVFAAACFAKDATSEERWFKAKYSSKPISAEFVAAVKAKPVIGEFAFPKPNPFIAVSFCYPDKDAKNEKLEKQDDLLAYESGKGFLTYGNAKCQKGLLPSAQYAIDLYSPVLEDDSDLTSNPCSEVLVTLLKFMLEAELGAALCSLISYDVELFYGAQGFIRIMLAGPSPKLPELAKTMLSTVEKFDRLANQYSNTIKDFKSIQIEVYKNAMNVPETCAQELLRYILNYRALFLSDYIYMLEDAIDLEEFLFFVLDFKRKLYFKGDLNGCVSRSHAIQVAQGVDKFQCKEYEKKLENEVVDRMIELPLGERCLLVSAKPKEDRTVAVLNYYQVGVVNRDQRRMITAISSYLGEIVFEELRTKQSLGYHAEALLNNTFGIYGVTVFVQGAADKHTCGYINERIDKFIEAAFKNCFATRTCFKHTVEAYLDANVKLSYAETNNFYAQHLLPSGDKLRKLSIQIQGHQKPKSEPLQPALVEKKVEKYSSGIKLYRRPETATCGISNYSNYLELLIKGVKDKNGYFITDVQEFKADLACYQNLELTDWSDDDNEN